MYAFIKIRGYRINILPCIKAVSTDPHCLALLKHYRSLMPLAQEAHKPIFHLKPADGAIGAHIHAVQGAYIDFEKLAQKIIEHAHIVVRR